ncbi:hypothetical protein EJB05_28003, partial [Eragrostis curvula]
MQVQLEVEIRRLKSETPTGQPPLAAALRASRESICPWGAPGRRHPLRAAARMDYMEEQAVLNWIFNSFADAKGFNASKD